MKEETIATYTTKNFRLQLLKITTLVNYMNNKFTEGKIEQGKDKLYYNIKYQVRLNRKIIQTSISEYTMRKLFAMYVQNQILQLKIY